MLNRNLRVPYSAWDFLTGALWLGAACCVTAWGVSDRDWGLVAAVVVGVLGGYALSFYEHRTLPPAEPDPESRTKAVLGAIIAVAVCGVAPFLTSDPYLLGTAAFILVSVPAAAAAHLSGPRPDRDALSKPAERVFTWVPLVITLAISIFVIDYGPKKKKRPTGQQKIEIIRPGPDRR